MPKSKKKKMKKKKKSAAKKPSVVGPSAEEPSTEGPSALSQLGSKITGAALVTANQIVPKIPQKEINKASQQIGKKRDLLLLQLELLGLSWGPRFYIKLRMILNSEKLHRN